MAAQAPLLQSEQLKILIGEKNYGIRLKTTQQA